MSESRDVRSFKISINRIERSLPSGKRGNHRACGTPQAAKARRYFCADTFVTWNLRYFELFWTWEIIIWFIYDINYNITVHTRYSKPIFASSWQLFEAKATSGKFGWRWCQRALGRFLYHPEWGWKEIAVACGRVIVFFLEPQWPTNIMIVWPTCKQFNIFHYSTYDHSWW